VNALTVLIDFPSASSASPQAFVQALRLVPARTRPGISGSNPVALEVDEKRGSSSALSGMLPSVNIRIAKLVFMLDSQRKIVKPAGWATNAALGCPHRLDLHALGADRLR
jgi:hypothetical protein